MLRTTEPSAKVDAPIGSRLAECVQVGVRHEGREAWQPQATTLNLTPGRLVALIGPSGCGKSSLTLTLNGLVPHSVPSAYRGSVLIKGKEAADQAIHQLATTVAMVLQDPDAQIITTSVLDEVTWGLSNLCLPPEEIRSRAQKALTQVGLLDETTRNPWELSGGQRQRLVLASALAMRPELLVLDEPTANIDPASGEQLYRILADEAHRGTAVVVVEHNLDPIIGHVDEVIALDATGATLTQGPPGEVLHRHRDALLAAGIQLPTCVRLADRIPELRGALTLQEGAAVLAGHPEARAALAAHIAELRRPTAHAPGLSVAGLRLQLGSGPEATNVLDGVDFHAPAGALTAVVGVNGAGKSTLLRSLSGLHPGSRADTCTTATGPIRLTAPDPRVGHVFQNPQHQFLHSTLREELAHSGRVNHAPAQQVQAEVAALLTELGLTGMQELSPFLLSGGQQRRLSVATALSEGREVLCLDEPTFGQDAESTRVLMELLARTAARGTTIIMATHDLGLVLEHAAHVVVLHEGRVRAEGPPCEVLLDPVIAECGLTPPPVLRLAAAAVEGMPDEPPATGATSAPDEPQSQPDLPEAQPSPVGPLTLFLSLLPAMVLVALTGRHEFSLTCLILASVFLLARGRGGLAHRAVLVAGLWAVAALLTWSAMVAYRFDLHGASPPVRIGPFSVDEGQWLAGIKTGLRISALLALVVASGALTSPQELLRSLTRTFRLPVRIAHAGMAAVAFLERFRTEHRIIRQARRMRGSRAPGVLRPVVIWAGSVTPLLVSAIRHAERVSMAMDARAFGAHRRRTELTEVRWRLADSALLLLLWALTLALALVLHHFDLLGRIALDYTHHG